MCYNIFQKIKVMRMKLKTRLMVAFLTVTVVPMLLIFMAFMGLSSYQTGEIRKNYGLLVSLQDGFKAVRRARTAKGSNAS